MRLCVFMYYDMIPIASDSPPLNSNLFFSFINTYLLFFSYAQVVIITNSDEGWVNYSAERYLPNLIPFLQDYRIISARTRYEKFYPNQPLCWKAAAFAHEVNEHFCSLEQAHTLLDNAAVMPGVEVVSKGFNDSIPDMDLVSTDDSSLGDTSLSSAEAESPGNDDGCDLSMKPAISSSSPISPIATQRPSIKREIVSFGDSIEERTAVKIVSDQLEASPKSVKFLNNPTPIQIIGQLTMLTHHMNFVCEHNEDLDLEISLQQAEKCASGYLARREKERQQGSREAASPSILQRMFGTSSSSPQAQAVSSGDVDMYDC